MNALHKIFWVSFSLIIYTYLLYPLLLLLKAFFAPKPINKRNYTPSLSIVLAVYNEERVIGDKINSLLLLDYPEDKYEVLVGSDGSTDKTNQILKEISNKRLILYSWKQRRGKVSILNDLITHAKGEIILFTDARQRLEDNALKEIVKNFADSKIGCVSGELILESDPKSQIGPSLNLYWRYEKLIRKMESRIGSMLGATGAIYAIRKELYAKPDSDTLLDDVFIPLKIIEKGYRAIMDTSVKAYDRVSFNTEEESIRKVRTLAGNWQIFLRLSNLFNPFSSKIAIQLFSHKFLRMLIPFLMVSLYVSNLLIVDEFIYVCLAIAQITFYFLALLGGIFQKKKLGILKAPYVFCVLNFAALKGLILYITRSQKVTWERSKN